MVHMQLDLLYVQYRCMRYYLNAPFTEFERELQVLYLGVRAVHCNEITSNPSAATSYPNLVMQKVG